MSETLKLAQEIISGDPKIYTSSTRVLAAAYIDLYERMEPGMTPTTQEALELATAHSLWCPSDETWRAVRSAFMATAAELATATAELATERTRTTDQVTAELRCELESERERVRVATVAIQNAPHYSSCTHEGPDPVCVACHLPERYHRYEAKECPSSPENHWTPRDPKPCDCWKSRALAQLAQPVADSATVQPEQEKEWRVAWEYESVKGWVPRSMPQRTEHEADGDVLSRLHRFNNLWRDIRKQSSIDGGNTWQDAEAPKEPK